MTLETYEHLLTIVKNLIVICAAISGVIGAFFNQKMVHQDTLNERNKIPKNKKKLRILFWFKMHTKEWWIFFLSCVLVVILSFIQNWIESNIDDKKDKAQAFIDKKRQELQNKRDSVQEAKYFEQIRILKEDEREGRISTQKQTKVDIVDMQNNMIDRFSKYYTQNSKEHKVTQEKVSKIDTLRSISAFVDFLPEPSNVLKFYFVKDTLKVFCFLRNLGNSPAYALENSEQIIVVINGKFFKFRETEMTKPTDLFAQTDRLSKSGYLLSEEVYKNVDEIYMIVRGTYFLDEKKIVKKEFKEALVYNIKERYSNNYDLKISIDSLNNFALPINDIQLLKKN